MNPGSMVFDFHFYSLTEGFRTTRRSDRRVKDLMPCQRNRHNFKSSFVSQSSTASSGGELSLAFIMLPLFSLQWTYFLFTTLWTTRVLTVCGIAPEGVKKTWNEETTPEQNLHLP
jgi:hypothetical protein